MRDKIVVVTGATNGIGYATALGLAKKGAQVIAIGRSHEKATQAVTRIRQETGNQNVQFLIADLSVQANIRLLAAEIKSAVPHIDVLVNNAGGMFTTRQVTDDGIEMTWALNHLAYFLTTLLLLEHLSKAPSARIVNVSSGLHGRAKLRFDDPELVHRYSGIFAYNHSKLANVMFTYELARQLQGTSITANSLHPGGVNTGIGDNNGPAFRNIYKLIKRFGLSPEEGAATSLYLATSEELAGVSGAYFEKCQAVQSSDASYVAEDQKRLWQMSANMVGI